MPWWGPIAAHNGVVTIIGCGARNFADCGAVSGTLEQLRNQYPLLTVIEGGARGADRCVATWAASQRVRGVGWTHMPANWEDYERHERWRAGHDRNQTMLDALLTAGNRSGLAVVAFKDQLDPALYTNRTRASGGTEDLIRRTWDTAETFGITIPTFLMRGSGHPVREIHPTEPPTLL